MKVYRVYGMCSGWECCCERTMKVFLDATKADNYLAVQSAEMIAEKCDFCTHNGLRGITVELEELEVEV